MNQEHQLAHIYAEVASGRALSRVVSDDDDMPSASTFWRWHMADPSIRDNLARAREHGVEAIVDECVDIADNQQSGIRRTLKADGTIETVEEDMLGHRKLRIETRLKYAQMIAPRKYGPKVDVTSGGERLATGLNLAGVSEAALRELAKAGDSDEADNSPS